MIPADAIADLLQAHPLDRAMGRLVGGEPHPELSARVEALGELPPSVAAGLWLYADDLVRSHEISQGIEDTTGSIWHAIMHRREGDFWNSKYWYRRAAGHPVLAALGWDAEGFVDRVEANAAIDPGALVQRQRQEWALLFDWCLQQEGLR